ncbi:MAG: transposase [Clostridia bacterium]|nr:transposase [Clostridia bacterium]
MKSKIIGITNYFESRLTNAVLERTNSTIQSIKSRARGYKNSDNFKAIIYLMNNEHRVIIFYVKLPIQNKKEP